MWDTMWARFLEDLHNVDGMIGFGLFFILMVIALDIYESVIYRKWEREKEGRERQKTVPSNAS